MKKKNSHFLLFSKNKKNWIKKKIIREIYKTYYMKIKKNIIDGKSLEVGSGFGEIKKYIDNCITSDQFSGMNIDKVENVYELTFNENTFDNIIMIDVFHHLKYPGSALKELTRVLKTKGQIIMIEPAMGLIPRIVYSLFHHEPNGFNYDIQLYRKSKSILNRDEYFAVQSLPWRFFVLKQFNIIDKLNLKNVSMWSDFSFLLSGGLSYPALYPFYLLKFIQKIDRLLSFISKNIFSARMMIILEKKK
tara:strand:- start:70 stop:810 length:741 start_codon:yes stop_codon:yes gene_type:complete